MVFFYHIVSQYLVDAVPEVTALARSFLFDGQLAVLVFFVISGYALSAATVAGKEVDFRLAIVARYFRLAIPIGVVTFATLLLLKANLFFHQDVAMQGVGARWMLPKYLFDPTVYGAVKFALYNVFFAYFPQSSYNVVLWTISIEFLGSLALFAYLSVFRRDGHGPTGAAERSASKVARPRNRRLSKQASTGNESGCTIFLGCGSTRRA